MFHKKMRKINFYKLKLETFYEKLFNKTLKLYYSSILKHFKFTILKILIFSYFFRNHSMDSLYNLKIKNFIT